MGNQLTFKEAMEIRETPEFKAIEEKVAAIYAAMEQLKKECEAKYPLEDGYVWMPCGYDPVRLRPYYTKEDEDY